MIAPPFLKKKDTLALVASASYITSELVHSAINTFQQWGFRTHFTDSFLEKQGNFACTSHAVRKDNFQEALDNPDIKAIIALRGGYGSVHIVDELDFSQFQKYPKWLVGFSDLTVLHLKMQALGFQSIHAPMPSTFSTTEEQALLKLKESLLGSPIHYKVSPHPANCLGEVKATVVGGNLCNIVNQVGTSTDMDPSGKILFLEEVNEPLYHIDRMFNQLRRSGKLNHLKALIVGGFSNIKPEDPPFHQDIIAIVKNHTDAYHYPVCFHFPVGHIPDNRTIICGRESLLVIREDEVNFYQ